MQVHLNTYGTYLHVKDQLFEIKVPSDKGTKKHQVAAHKIKNIWIAKGIALSSDAVRLAMKHNIDIVFLEYDGHPIARVWHSKLGSTTLIRKRQLEVSLQKESLDFVKEWLSGKVNHQLEFIQSLKKHRPQHHDFLTDKVERIEVLKTQIESAEANHVDEVADSLRGWELSLIHI